VLINLKIDRMEPFADGQEFGAAGGYLRITGTAYGELDPDHPLNAVIVNLDKAPRNGRGLVEYEVGSYSAAGGYRRGNRKISGGEPGRKISCRCSMWHRKLSDVLQ
jgi:hypothetical protein